MGRNYYKLIIVLSILINACAFDPPDEKFKELGGNYYLSYASHSPNDGLKIVYTEDKEFFRVMASNCIDIYRDSGVIIYSKSLFEGDTTNVEYFLIYLNPKNEVKKINSNTYNRKIVGLEKIDLFKE